MSGGEFSGFGKHVGDCPYCGPVEPGARPTPSLPTPAWQPKPPTLWTWTKANARHFQWAVVSAVVAALLWGLGSCVVAANAERERKADAWDRNPTNPVNVCIAKGGVPIYDTWTGGLDRCEFPPKGSS